MDKSTDFSQGKIFPLILKFSIPAALSLLITAVYNIVDRIFVGNISGNTALAALSICFPLSFMMIAFGLMCSAGGSTMFTLFRGKGEDEKGNQAFGSAFVTVVIFEIILTLLLYIFADFFLNIFGVTETTYELAMQYYRIVAAGCIFQGVTMVFMDFVRVSGKPILGMSVTAVGAVTNIILDAIFVVGLNWGVKGAATATVMGQVVSALFGAYLVFGGKTLVHIKKATFRLKADITKLVLNCGLAFWIAQMAMGFIALVYNSQLGKYGGDTAISVYAVISSIMTFVTMPASGISQGIQPIVGFNYSKGNGKRVKQIFIQGAALAVGVTAVFWILTMVFPTAIINMFGGGDMLEIGVPALRYNFMIAPIIGLVLLATTFFQAIGHATMSTVITLIRQVIAIIPLIYIFPMFFGTMGIFFAQPVADLFATIIAVVLLKKLFAEIAHMKTVE